MCTLIVERYVDDILEIIKKEQVENLTQHLNKADAIGNFKFTYEEEEGKISFLDTPRLLERVIR